jgi:hypothetical protein
MKFLDPTQLHTTVGMTPLNKWSARRKDLYLTTHNTHNRLTSMPTVGYETSFSAWERPQTYALDRAATGTCCIFIIGTRHQGNLTAVYPVIVACQRCNACNSSNRLHTKHVCWICCRIRGRLENTPSQLARSTLMAYFNLPKLHAL